MLRTPAGALQVPPQVHSSNPIFVTTGHITTLYITTLYTTILCILSLQVTFRDASLRRATYIPSTDGCEGTFAFDERTQYNKSQPQFFAHLSGGVHKVH